MRVSREFIERAIEENGYLAVWIGTQVLLIRPNDALVNTAFGTMHPDRDEMVLFVISKNWQKVNYRQGRWILENRK